MQQVLQRLDAANVMIGQADGSVASMQAQLVAAAAEGLRAEQAAQVAQVEAQALQEKVADLEVKSRASRRKRSRFRTGFRAVLWDALQDMLCAVTFVSLSSTLPAVSYLGRDSWHLRPHRPCMVASLFRAVEVRTVAAPVRPDTGPE
jgi:hypothetical protein